MLKDASATAIYGTRAANGVIVVTTRRGSRDGFSFSYQHTSSVSMRPTYDDFNLMDSKERTLLAQQALDAGFSESWPSVGLDHYVWQYSMGNLTREEMEARVNAAEALNTDWFKLLYRNAYAQTHAINFSGGGDEWDYYLSFNYNDEQGADRISDYRSFGGFGKVNMELFRGVQLGALVQFGRRERELYHEQVDPFAYATGTARTFGPYDEHGDLFYYRRSASGGYLFNIYNEQDNTFRGSTQNDIKAIFDLSVNLYKNLKYVGLYSYSTSNSTSTDWATERTAYIARQRGYNLGQDTQEDIDESPLPFGGQYHEKTYEYINTLIRNGLEYKGTLFPGMTLDAIAGQEFRTTDYKGLESTGWGYMHDRGNIFYAPAAGAETGHISRNTLDRTLPRRSYVSYYGVLSLMFRNRYIVNGNVRFDGSNLFGSNPKYRWLPLWSVSGKWIISQERFMKDLSAVNHLALRASYGLRGNIVEDSSPQIIATALPPNEFTNLLEMEVEQAPNPELKWENTRSLNIGFELGMFSDRLSLTLDYYRDYSENLIAYKDVSTVSGYKAKYVNYADVRNEGFEVSLRGTPVRRGDFSWSTSLNLAFVKNEVVRSYITPSSSSLVSSIYIPGQVYEGRPVNGMFSYRFAGLNDDGLSSFYDAEGNKVDSGSSTDLINKIYNDLGNLKYEGTRDPRITGGWTNTFRYRDFTLSFLFSFGLDYAVRLPGVAVSTKPGSDANANRSLLDRWQKSGDEATKSIPRFSSGDYVFGDETINTAVLFNMSDRTVIPGDYLRLRNLVLEYRLPAALAQKIGIDERRMKGLSLKFQAQNLFTIKDSRMKGYDPETINYTTSGYGSLPLQRKFTIGLNINF